MVPTHKHPNHETCWLNLRRLINVSRIFKITLRRVLFFVQQLDCRFIQCFRPSFRTERVVTIICCYDWFPIHSLLTWHTISNNRLMPNNILSLVSHLIANEVLHTLANQEQDNQYLDILVWTQGDVEYLRTCYEWVWDASEIVRHQYQADINK